MPCVAERPDADRRRWSRAGRDPRIRIVIRGSKPGPVTAVAKTRQHDVPGHRALRRHLIERLLAGFEAGQALPGIASPRAIIDALCHRFAELAIPRHIDAEFALIPHDIHNRSAERCLERARICRLAGIAGTVCLDQRIRPRQAADMAGQNVILARPHGWSPRYTQPNRVIINWRTEPRLSLQRHSSLCGPFCHSGWLSVSGGAYRLGDHTGLKTRRQI